jgi:hypothetical protein
LSSELSTLHARIEHCNCASSTVSSRRQRPHAHETLPSSNTTMQHSRTSLIGRSGVYDAQLCVGLFDGSAVSDVHMQCLMSSG